MDFIEEVLESTQFFEAPRRFYYWSSLAAVSAVVKDRVYFDMAGNYLLYPNIYVLLYGPSAVKKGPPIALAQDLVTRVDATRVIDGRSSIEAVLKELGTIYTRPDKTMVRDSCGFLVSGELSSSIISNTAAMDIMTNLYDRQYNIGEWRYRLKVSEGALLNKPTITWLTGTNEALFRDFIPEKNLQGGLIGRMFVISENEDNMINSLMFKTKAPDRGLLAQKLKDISNLSGEFCMDNDVRHAVDSWYKNFKKNEAPKLMDNTGFTGRMGDFLIKMAMIISCARRGDKELIIDDVVEAKDLVTPLIVPAKKLINASKKTDESMFRKRYIVLNYLASRPTCSEERHKILQGLGLQIDAEDLDRIAQTLIQSQVLVIDTSAGRMIYKLRMDREDVVKYVRDLKGQAQ